jgi:hypothetical protein
MIWVHFKSDDCEEQRGRGHIGTSSRAKFGSMHIEHTFLPLVM